MVGLVDPKTGQVYDGLAVRRRGPHPYEAQGGYLLMAQPMLDQMAKDRDIGGETLRVFLLVVARLQFGGVAEVNQGDLAADLGIARQSVNRSIRLLVKKGVLSEDQSTPPGSTKRYSLNPFYGYKGNSKELKAAQQHHLKLVHVSEPAPELLR